MSFKVWVWNLESFNNRLLLQSLASAPGPRLFEYWTSQLVMRPLRFNPKLRTDIKNKTVTKVCQYDLAGTYNVSLRIKRKLFLPS